MYSFQCKQASLLPKTAEVKKFSYLEVVIIVLRKLYMFQGNHVKLGLYVVLLDIL